MGKKAKELCKWKSKDAIEDFDAFTKIIKNPKYVCQKCGWVATKKKWLHKPSALKQ